MFFEISLTIARSNKSSPHSFCLSTKIANHLKKQYTTKLELYACATEIILIFFTVFWRLFDVYFGGIIRMRSLLNGGVAWIQDGAVGSRMTQWFIATNYSRRGVYWK